MFDELFRNTLSPWQWATVAAVPPAILALYFLKLRRSPLEVPSTYLWLRAIEDLRVNSLWQRLRRSVLLLLQLLAVTLAALALLRPGWQGTRVVGTRLVLVIDNSASMATRDADASGRTRLEVAKEKAAALVDQMERGMTAMVVSFAKTPRVAQEFTDNTRLIREALAAIPQTSQPTDLAGALELADGLANPAQVKIEEGAPEVAVVEPEPASLYIFSDGRFGDVKDFALGNLEPVYVPMGRASTANLAITALETRRGEAGQSSQAFLQAANYTEKPVDAVVELSLGGKLLDAQRMTIAAGDVFGLTLPLGEPEPGDLRATISKATRAGVDDRLGVDDVGFAAINQTRAGRVLLATPGNVALERALETERARRIAEVEVVDPSVLGTAEHRRRAGSGEFDLIIYDRCTPVAEGGTDPMPQASTVFVGASPPTAAWQGAGQKENRAPIAAPRIIDWNRSHPLLASAELGDFDIVESMVVAPPPGGTTLIDAAEGPIAAVAPRSGRQDVVLGFPILVEDQGRTQRNTDWINRHSFPTFWLNVLEHLVGSVTVEGRSVRPGESVSLRPLQAATSELEVTAPDGAKTILRRRGDDPFVFQATEAPGVYLATEPSGKTQRFAVNLFDRAESDVRLRVETPEDASAVAAVAGLKIGATRVAATAGGAPARSEVWKPLLVAVLAVLLAEWWVYHRRVSL